MKSWLILFYFVPFLFYSQDTLSSKKFQLYVDYQLYLKNGFDGNQLCINGNIMLHKNLLLTFSSGFFYQTDFKKDRMVNYYIPLHLGIKYISKNNKNDIQSSIGKAIYGVYSSDFYYNYNYLQNDFWISNYEYDVDYYYERTSQWFILQLLYGRKISKKMNIQLGINLNIDQDILFFPTFLVGTSYRLY